MARIALPERLLTLPIAHRALHNKAAGRIENSPSAIRAAIDAGYAIEIDLQLSADDVAMVFHDDDLDRLTEEKGPVSARTAAELGQIRLKGSTDFIPTFTDVLALVAGRVPLLIELKDQTGNMGPSDGRLEAATVAALADYAGEVALMSFNPHSIDHMAHLAPHLARGLTTSAYIAKEWAPLAPQICDHLRDIPDYERVGASFVSHEAKDLDRPRLAEIKAADGAILCWTITSATQEAEARKIAQNVTFEAYLAHNDQA